MANPTRAPRVSDSPFGSHLHLFLHVLLQQCLIELQAFAAPVFHN